MKYWFWVKGSGFNASFSINIRVSINVLSAKHIATQGRTECPWKNNKVGSGLRTGTERILVFTWKPRLSVLEWTCICLHLFLWASYYVPTSNSEWRPLWDAVSVLSQWFPDQVHMAYKSKDDFLSVRALNSIRDQKIKHCFFRACVKCSRQNAKHV